MDGKQQDDHERREPEDSRETLRQAMAAMSERHRHQLIWLVKERERSVGELVEALNWPQPLVSHHLGILFRAGLVAVERQGRRRLYRIADPSGPRLRMLMELVGLLGKRHAPFVETDVEVTESNLAAALRGDETSRRIEMEDYLL